MVLSAGAGDPANTLLVKAHETLTFADASRLGSLKSLRILVSLRPGREVAQSWKHLSSESQQARTVEEILAINIEIQNEILKFHEDFPIMAFSWNSPKINQIIDLLSFLSLKPSIWKVLSLFVLTSKPWNRVNSFLQTKRMKFSSFNDGHVPGTLWHQGHIAKLKIFHHRSETKPESLSVTTHSLIQEMDATTEQIISKFGKYQPKQRVLGDSNGT